MVANCQSILGVLFTNAVGIDVFIGKIMVSILCPFVEVVAQPFEIRHTSSDSLASYFLSMDVETQVILKHTGRCYEPVAQKTS